MRRSRGISLVELMLAVAITSVLVLGYASFQNLNVKSAGQAQITHALETLRGSYVSLLSDREAFYNTIRQNYNAPLSNAAQVGCVWSMICDPTKEAAGGFPACPASAACTSGAPDRMFNLFPAEPGRPATYDAINADSGVTLQGGPCRGFDPVNGNDQCPFRFDLKWKAECDDAACNCVSFVADARLKVKFRGDTDLGKYYANLKTMNELQRAFPELRIPVSRGRLPFVELQVFLPNTANPDPLNQTFEAAPLNKLYEIWRRTPACNPDTNRVEGTAARIRVVRSTNSENYCQSLQVNYRIGDPTDADDAIYGTDYTLNNATAGSLLIPVPSATSSAYFEILPLPTERIRDNKHVTVRLLPGNGYEIPDDSSPANIYKKQKTIVIRDNHEVTGTLAFSAGTYNIDSQGGTSISVTASGAVDEDINFADSFTDAAGNPFTLPDFLALEGGGCRTSPLKYKWKVVAVDKHTYSGAGYPALNDVVFANGGVNNPMTISPANGNVDGRFKIEVVANDGPCADAAGGICTYKIPLSPTHPGVYGIANSFWIDAYKDDAPILRHRPGGPNQFPPWFNVTAVAPPFNVDFSPYYEVKDDGRIIDPLNVTFSSTSPGAFLSGPTFPAVNGSGWNSIPSAGPAPVYAYSFSGPGQVISLVADDGFKSSNTITENNVNINQCPHSAAIADPGSPTPNVPFNLNATFGDDPYPSGSTSYSWTGDGATTFVTPNGTVAVGAPGSYGVATTATVTTAGAHPITLTVSDGQCSTSVTRFVNGVAPPNVPPNVAIANIPAQVIGTPFAVSGSYTDPDSTGPTYNWTLSASPSVGVSFSATSGTIGGASNTIPATVTIANAGTYTITFTVDDGFGPVGAVSNSFNVAAAPPPNVPPTVTIGNIPVQKVGVLFGATATYNDPDSAPGPYTFTWSSSPAGAVLSPSGGFTGSPSGVTSTNVTIGATGNYTINFTIDDGSGTPVTVSSNVFSVTP